VEFAGGEGVGVDDDRDVGLERSDLLMSSCDQLAESLGGQPVAVAAAICRSTAPKI
jgi:hypothetical protein